MNPIYDDEDEEFVISKTKRKKEMHDLQDIGEELVESTKQQLAELDLDESLLDAVLECKNYKFEARRRQLQYIGKLMRNIDIAPIQEKLRAWKGVSNDHKAHLHLLERWRDRLLENDNALQELANTYSDIDMQRLRTLIRNAHKEKAASKPPKSFRLIYQELHALIPETPLAGQAPSAESES